MKMFKNKSISVNWGMINFLLISIAIVCSFFFLRSCGKNPIPDIVNVPKENTVVNNITQKQKEIHTIEKQVVTKQANEESLDVLKREIFAELAKYRKTEDYPRIIRIQDSVINIQEQQIDTLRGIITLKDTQLTAQRYIIDSKDTLISISKADAKKYKKQRNILALIAIVEAGVIIVK